MTNLKYLKMRNIKIFVLAFLAALTASCSDDDKLPLDVADLETGAYLRTIDIESGGFDYLNLSSSEFAVVVEAYDDNNGELIESIDVFVDYDDRTPEDGGSDVEETLLKTLPASEFFDGENNLPRAKISASSQETLSALGLSESDLAPGDRFGFRLAINLTTGQTFSADNTNANLSGQFFRSPFRYRAPVGCPLEENKFSGEYQVTLINGTGPFGRFAPEQFTADLSPVTRTQRRFEFSYLPDIGGFAETFEVEFICTKAVVVRHTAGVGCGAGGIVWGPEGASTEFNIDDDSSFTLSFSDFVEDSGCGVSPYPVTLQFEKI